VELAHAVKEVASQENCFQFLYNLQVGPVITLIKYYIKLFEDGLITTSRH